MQYINEGYKIAHQLLGIIHGHYNHIGETDFEKLNTGIAVIVPVEKTFETIEHAIKAKVITLKDQK